MEILVLIGIFAFVIAILFRSNEALDRVDVVEKEVKTIEEEIGHTKMPAEETPQPPVQEAEVHVVPVEPVVSQAEALVDSIPVAEAQPHLEVESEPVGKTAGESFPKMENVHMNQ